MFHVLLYGKNKDADQLHGYCTADLQIFYIYVKSRYSHDAASMLTELQHSYHNDL